MGDVFEPLERQWLQLAPGHWRRETADEMTTRIGDAIRAAMHSVAKRPTWWRAPWSPRREWWR
jgi:hypothetical protein